MLFRFYVLERYLKELWNLFLPEEYLQPLLIRTRQGKLGHLLKQSRNTTDQTYYRKIDSGSNVVVPLHYRKIKSGIRYYTTRVFLTLQKST